MPNNNSVTKMYGSLFLSCERSGGVGNPLASAIASPSD